MSETNEVDGQELFKRAVQEEAMAQGIQALADTMANYYDSLARLRVPEQLAFALVLNFQQFVLMKQSNSTGGQP